MANSGQLQRQLRIALQNGDYAEAIACLEQAAAAAHEAKDRAAEGRHLGNLALIYNRLQRPDMALRYFQQALALARAEGDRITEDGLLGNMGNILRELRHFDEAIEHLNQALLIAQEIGDVRGRGIWLSNLGLVYDDLEQPAKAADYHAQSVVIARQLQDWRGLALRLEKLGNTLLNTGNHEESLQCFVEAYQLYEALGLTDFLSGLQQNIQFANSLRHSP